MTEVHYEAEIISVCSPRFAAVVVGRKVKTLARFSIGRKDVTLVPADGELMLLLLVDVDVRQTTLNGFSSFHNKR